MSPAFRRGEVWVALGVIALGAFLLFQTSQIHATTNYARVGPTVFPWIISAVLVLLGIVLLRDGLTGRWVKDPTDVENLPPPDRASLLWLVVGLALYLLTVGYGGFPIATCLLFAFAARGFGSRRLVLDLVLGLIIGVAVYVGFHHGLGLTLPAGVLEFILG